MFGVVLYNELSRRLSDKFCEGYGDLTMNDNIFSSADILLPPYKSGDPAWESWSVIACDQFTSEMSYWDETEKLTAGAYSTYHVILPEAYLGTAKEDEHKAKITEDLKSYAEWLKKYESSFVYVERTLSGGAKRVGIVGKIDLEKYDYSPLSSSPVRATEATVVERIPPREKIRASADIELPHIMIFAASEAGPVFECAKKAASALEPAYDFELLQGGGRLRGTIIGKDAIDGVISEYESAREGGVAYAMGDGNHSLAAAKSHYEHIKEKLGDSAKAHPARYALAEIVLISDESIVFEPIYRLVKTADDGSGFVEYLKSLSGKGTCPVTVVSGGREYRINIPEGDAHTSAGAVQAAVDGYIKLSPGATVDYIHGEDSLRSLAKENGNVGIIFDGLDKIELIPYIEKWGTLPKKTFSMGEAKSKRYYTEARSIV